MGQLRLKFIWGAAGRIKGNWHLGLWGHYEHVTGYPRSGLAISVRGLLLWGALMTLLAYLLGVTALYVFVFKRDPYNQVTYADTLLLPVRWERVSETRGRMLIAAGLDDLNEQRFGEAAMKLRTGLARVPQDASARMAYARFLVAAGQRSQALQVLTEGLNFGYPGRAYLESLFGLASDGEDFDVVIAACDRFPNEAGDRAWLSQQRNVALLRAHRPGEVLQRIDGNGPAHPDADREARVTALLELKRAPEALAELDRWESHLTPNSRLLVARLRVRALRDAGRIDEMNTALEHYRGLVPTDPRALAFVVAQRWLARATTDAAAALEEYFLRFGGEEANFVVIATALTEAKAGPLVKRCVAEATVHGFGSRSLKIALARAQLVAGNWSGADELLAGLRDDPNETAGAEAFVAEWMRRVLAVIEAPEDAPPKGLVGFFQRRPVPVPLYRQTLELLIEAQRPKAAEQVLDLALKTYPSNAMLVGWRSRFDRGEAQTTRSVVRAEPMMSAMTEEKLFRQFATDAAAGRWAAVADGARAVRVAKPEWFAAREPDVLGWQIRAAAAQDELADLLAAARLLLDGSGARADRVMELAHTLRAAGDLTNSVRLAQEVLRRNPKFPQATKALDEWLTAAKAATPAGENGVAPNRGDR